KLKSGGYRLYSRKVDPKTGKRRNLGTFGTRAEAEQHERAVQLKRRVAGRRTDGIVGRDGAVARMQGGVRPRSGTQRGGQDATNPTLRQTGHAIDAPCAVAYDPA